MNSSLGSEAGVAHLSVAAKVTGTPWQEGFEEHTIPTLTFRFGLKTAKSPQSKSSKNRNRQFIKFHLVDGGFSNETN